MTNPPPPFLLATHANAIWAKLFTLLTEDAKLRDADHYLLARYCEGLAEWEELNEWRKKNDVFIEMRSAKGATYMVKHPKISRLENLDQQLPRMEKALGIGAKARGTGGGKAKGQDLNAWLERTLNPNS